MWLAWLAIDALCSTVQDLVPRTPCTPSYLLSTFVCWRKLRYTHTFRPSASATEASLGLADIATAAQPEQVLLAAAMLPAPA
jgi:hypothetical protein